MDALNGLLVSDFMQSQGQYQHEPVFSFKRVQLIPFYLLLINENPCEFGIGGHETPTLT